ncbi:MAG: cysteine hydrolase, partial [SAR324 cluster bacterium]|nr:cysteine hydrolase [SAR324 cluster bacterium]
MNTKHDHNHCNHQHDGHVEARSGRRGFLKAGVAAGAAVAAVGLAGSRAEAGGKGKYADPKKAALPPSDMVLDLKRTAVVITDPQVDFLSPKGVTWGVVGKSVTEHNTVANLGRLMAAAKQTGMLLAISPHYYYPTDKGWKFEGGLEKLMHKIGMFNRKNPYTMDN